MNTIEKIVLAAVRLDNGLIFTGKCHADCIYTVILVNEIKEKIPQSKQGFVTTRFRFVDRKEAAEIAFKAGQIKKQAEVLLSEDLIENK